MASSEVILGSVDMWPLSWAPNGWTLCNGQLLQVRTNQALFSLLGVYFGGDGVQTFGVPNLQGRVPVGVGDAQYGSAYTLGRLGGKEAVTLTGNELPTHNHPSGQVNFNLSAMTGMGTYSNDPTNNYPGTAPTGKNIYGPNANAKMAQNNITVSVQNTGSSQPINVMKPYQVLNYIIALVGYYPTRP